MDPPHSLQVERPHLTIHHFNYEKCDTSWLKNIGDDHGLDVAPSVGTQVGLNLLALLITSIVWSFT